MSSVQCAGMREAFWLPNSQTIHLITPLDNGHPGGPCRHVGQPDFTIHPLGIHTIKNPSSFDYQDGGGGGPANT